MGRYRQDDGSTSSGHNSELFSNEIFNWHLPRYSLHEAAGINLRSSESPLLIIWTFLLYLNARGLQKWEPSPSLGYRRKGMEMGTLPRTVHSRTGSLAVSSHGLHRFLS